MDIETTSTRTRYKISLISSIEAHSVIILWSDFVVLEILKSSEHRK